MRATAADASVIRPTSGTTEELTGPMVTIGLVTTRKLPAPSSCNRNRDGMASAARGIGGGDEGFGAPEGTLGRTRTPAGGSAIVTSGAPFEAIAQRPSGLARSSSIDSDAWC